MRRYLTLFLVGVLVLVSVTPSLAAGSSDTWWTTRGRSREHGNAAVEPFGNLAFAWSLDLGLSASQPVFVDGVVYHLTDQGLWKITFDEQGLPKAEKVVDGTVNDITIHRKVVRRASTSGITYAEVGAEKTGVLYFGTGGNLVCAYVLASRESRCEPLMGEAPIVSTPLVFSLYDVVIMGDKAGYLWAIKGLASSGPIRYDIRRLMIGDKSTWITSSPTVVVEAGNRMDFLFSAYVAGGGEGEVGLARVEVPANGKPILTALSAGQPPSGGLWTSEMGEGRGMADGFTVDNEGAWGLVSDLQGYGLRLDVSSGRSLGVKPDGLRFANDMAAIDSDGQTVFFTMRNVGTDKESFTEPGSIVAIDMSDWTRKKWEAFLEAGAGAANTPPLVWDDVVLVGTTKGYIYGFDRNTGQPKSFAAKRLPLEFVDQDTSDGTKMGLLKRGEVPYRAEYAYQALSGAGVQPIVASGGTGETLLLMGVNYCQGAAPCAGNGRLMAFRALTDDPYLSGVSCPPTAMQWFDGAVHMGFRSTRSASFTGTLQLTVNGTSRPPVPVSIPPGGSFRQPLRIEGQGPGTVTVAATLVPASGFKDSDLTNNQGSCTVTVTDCPDCTLPPPTGPGAVIIGP